jgi:NAD(P)H-flavin reductase
MFNPYLPKFAKVLVNQSVSNDTNYLELAFKDPAEQKSFNSNYLRFVMVGIPGWGEGAFSITSSPQEKNFLAIGVRKVGMLTEKIHQLKKGDLVTIRGPFGNGLPKSILAKDLILIGGGCGFVPLRPLVQDFSQKKLAAKSLRVIYGCRNEQTILWSTAHSVWQKNSNFQMILEQPDKQWPGPRGLITDLLKKQPVKAGSTAILVGPPVMYRFVIDLLLAQGILETDIYLSLERKMYCGIGVCQHCAMGPYYICKDGPVVSYDQIKDYYQTV